jgi:hypothetical protein
MTKSVITKADTITVRLSPRIKYGLELLSRMQHRTLSDVVNWAIESIMRDRQRGLFDKETGVNMLEQAWEPHLADRIIKLAVLYPNLLNYEEELLWKLIQEHEVFWKKHFQASLSTPEQSKAEVWDVVHSSLRFDLLRAHWDSLKSSLNDPVAQEKLLSELKKE